jgi:hypothetical protein
MFNAWSESSASHSCSQRQRIILCSLTDMSDKAAPPRSLDELIEAACDCLEQYRERSMDDKLERALVDKAVQQTIHQGSKPSLRDSKRPFKLMMPAWRPVRPLLLPFCLRLIQGTYKKGIPAYLNMEEFLYAVRSNEITRTWLQRSAPEVKTATTIQAKLIFVRT